jgi:flagella basal body P-ring formation protein FlgA
MITPGKAKLMGQVHLGVAVHVNGHTCGKIYLSGWLDRFKPVVCAKRFIPKHALVSENDLGVELINISKGSRRLVTLVADAVGKRAKRNISAGSLLKHYMLETPPLVFKGDRVQLVARSGGLTVLTVGIAKHPGGKGEQIQVENVTSKKNVVGRVTDASTVEVFF